MLRISLAFALCALALPAQKKPITIDTVSNPLAPHDAAGAPVWEPGGNRFAFRKGNAIVLYDVPSRTEKELLSLDAIEKAAVPLAGDERFDWQNRRVAESGFAWSGSGKELLIGAGGDVFLWRMDSGKWEQLTATPVPEHDAKLSPDGARVAFRRGHDLYALEIASKKLTRLTNDGKSTLLNGELDWVYPEELDLGTAYWWSPDSKSIAYLQFDVSHEFIYPQVDLLGVRAQAEPERYPQAGTPNPEVRLGVVAAVGGETRWMDLGEPRSTLLARVHWTPDSSGLAVERFNRVQNVLDLMLANASRGDAKILIHESDPYWINYNDDFRFLPDGRFLWTSERDGFRHLYLYAPDGKQIKQLTEGKWGITSVAAVDAVRGVAYFVSTEASPLERQLYSVQLNGKRRARISEGSGTHSVSMSPTAAHYLDTFSNLTNPPRRTIHSPDGKERAVFREANRSLVDEYEFLPAEIVTVKAADGTELYARLIKPANFQADRKYPAVVVVYGGPHVQTVRNGWMGATWDHVLAQRGFVVWQLDNRGSSGRGHAFETPLFRRLGKTELADQLEGVRYLTSSGFVDPARIGIYGWSYGGFMTLYSLLNAPDVFRAGIAGAPVVNWRNYDTIYTERYLGLPAENEAGYKESSPVEYAANLKSRLLLLHNIEDDNVLFQNTMQMTAALEKAGRMFDMVIYPLKSHGVLGPLSKHMLEKTTDFFERNLKQ